MCVLFIHLRLLTNVKCFPGYIFNFASTASKKLSESVAETAQNLKKSVEEGKINGIIDKVVCHGSVFGIRLFFYSKHIESGHLYSYPQTILGDFQKEQQRFVEEKKAKQSGS